MHLELAPSELLVLSEKVKRAHLGQEAAAQGAPASHASRWLMLTKSKRVCPRIEFGTLKMWQNSLFVAPNKNIARGTTDPGYWFHNFQLKLFKIDFSGTTWIGRKFSYQMAPLALVPNLVTRGRDLHKYQAGEVTQVMESIPWVRCASGNVFFEVSQFSTHPWYVRVCRKLRNLNKKKIFPLAVVNLWGIF